MGGGVAKAIAAAVCAASATAVPAHAGTAETGELDCRRVATARSYCTVTVNYRGAPGEANIVTVEPAMAGNQQAVRFLDAGARVEAGPGCTTGGDHEVTCVLPHADGRTVEVVAGDSADRVTANDPDWPVALRFDGGDGDDTLTGGPGTQSLIGGAGSDAIAAGPGDDLIEDSGPAGEADTVDGGDGRDRAAFHARREPLRATPAGSSDGDVFTGVEDVTGGAGDDVITGDDGNNSLGGGGGDDRIDGGAGDDRLAGGGGDDALDGGEGRDNVEGSRGRDRIEGGAGDDTVSPDDSESRDDGVPDQVDCGAGTDTALEVAVADFTEPGCERVHLHDQLQRFEPRLPLASPRSVVATLRASDCPNPRVCRTTLRISAAPGNRNVPTGTVLGETVGRGAQKRSVRLSSLGRALLARHRTLRVSVTVDQRSPGLRQRGGFTTELRLR